MSFPTRLAAGLLLAAAFLASSQPTHAQSRTYTLDADFAEGTLVNVNYDAPNNNQLQLNRGTAAFPFVNIAVSNRGTAVRANTETGVILGEYFTAPNGMGRDPSRTTVDQLGNVWVGNRAESGFVPAPVAQNKGSMARIGLILGGTRTDAAGNPDPNGQYLMGPFEYNTCEDRHGTTPGTAPDGLIKTSRGLGNILPWTNAGSADSFGGVSTAEDECIINYTRAGSYFTRTITIDQNNDVWVGGTGNRQHEKVNGVTGQPIPGTAFTFGCGGYGGFIDGNGVLWSMTSGISYLRYDTNTSTGACISLTNYGVGVDPNTGEIWITQLSGNRVHKVAPDGTLLGSFTHGNGNAQGVAVDNNGDVWVAHALFGATTVGHLRTDGTYIGNVALPGGSGPTGVAIDAAGKVWVANYGTGNAMRIDPQGGPIGADGITRVGAVDLTVGLGANAVPYNYSDMTGAVVAGVTAPQGTWTVIYDGGGSAIPWELVSWNASVPPGASVTVQVRAADSQADLGAESYAPVSNGVPFAGVVGRYIQVVTTLARAASSQDGPVLFDLTVSAQDGTPPPPVDTTAPVCGPIRTEQQNGYLTAIVSSAADPESGIARVVFRTLRNLRGFAGPDAGSLLGPYAQGEEATFDPAATPSVALRAERIGPGGGAFVARVYNGAGLWRDCDPVVSELSATAPEAFTLEAPYPNPARSSEPVRVAFGLAEASAVRIAVYDLVGREVARLVDSPMEAGRYEVAWDGRDAAQGALAAGVYVVRMEAGAFSHALRVTVMP
jgi:hypothetical protein